MLLLLEDTISLPEFCLLKSSCPFSVIVTEPSGDGDEDTPFSAEHSTDSHSLLFHQL